MRIAINAASLHVLNELGGYGPELVSRLTHALPNEQFLWLERTGWQLPFQLRKQKADVYIGLNAEGSTTSATPQVLITTGLTPSGSMVNKALFAATLRKATALISPSQYHKEQLLTQYKLNPASIHVIPPFSTRQYEPVSWEQREEIKDQYAGGNEYFLFTGNLEPGHHIGSLLRAFSVFKKWQKSSMKLLLVGNIPPKHEKELDELTSYRFRSDLVLMAPLPPQEMARLLSGAYAIVYPVNQSFSGKTVLEAMTAGIPVITSPGSASEEVAGAAALYADPVNSREIGEQMIRLYKDETLRIRLINAGKDRAKTFQGQTVNAVLNALLRSVAAV